MWAIAGYGAALGLVLGITLGYSFEHVKVVELEKAILETNLEAEKELTSLTERTNVEILETIKLNNEIDTRSAEYEQELGVLNTTLRGARLRKSPNKTSNCGTTKASNPPGEPESTTSTVDIPEGLHEFLTERTLIADRNTAYAVACYDFVVKRNCGIEKTKE